MCTKCFLISMIIGILFSLSFTDLKIYETLLDYTTLINCQALIQNSKIKIDEEDIKVFIFGVKLI